MTGSKTHFDLKAELKVKTDEMVSKSKLDAPQFYNKEVFSSLSVEEQKQLKKERFDHKKELAIDFRYDNESLLSLYKDKKELYIAKSIIQEYFSDPDLFKMSDSLPLEERWNKIDEILNQKKEKIVWNENITKREKEYVYRLVVQILKQDDIENNPKFAKFTREHSDIILSKEPTENNKFILIGINNFDNKNMFFDIAMATDYPVLSATPENVLSYIKRLSYRFKDEETKIKYFTDIIFRYSSQEYRIIARPQIYDVFHQHYMIHDKFAREHGELVEDSRTIDWYRTKDTSLIFGEEQQSTVINFVKWLIEIIDNETDYNIAVEKLNKLKKPNRFITYSVLGWWVMRLREDGKIFTTGKSEMYWSLSKFWTDKLWPIELRSKEDILFDILHKDFNEDELYIPKY